MLQKKLHVFRFDFISSVIIEIHLALSFAKIWRYVFSSGKLHRILRSNIFLDANLSSILGETFKNQYW